MRINKPDHKEISTRLINRITCKWIEILITCCTIVNGLNPGVSIVIVRVRVVKRNIIDWQTLFTWFWGWLPLRLSKRQSRTAVLFRLTLTRTITVYELAAVRNTRIPQLPDACVMQRLKGWLISPAGAECYWLSPTNDRIQLSLQVVVVGIISSQNFSLLNLLNFLLLSDNCIYGTAGEIKGTLTYRDLRSNWKWSMKLNVS